MDAEAKVSALRALLRDPFAHFTELTAWERTLASMAAFGMTQREIATHVETTEGNVNRIMFHIERKMGVNRWGLTKEVFRQIHTILEGGPALRV